MAPKKRAALKQPEKTAKPGGKNSAKAFPSRRTPDEADFTGGYLETIRASHSNGNALTVAFSADKKAVIVHGLLAAGVTQTPTSKDLSSETNTTRSPP